MLPCRLTNPFRVVGNLNGVLNEGLPAKWVPTSDCCCLQNAASPLSRVGGHAEQAHSGVIFSWFCRRSGGDPGRIRTCDHRLRRPVLYPAELRDQTLAAIAPQLREDWTFLRAHNVRRPCPGSMGPGLAATKGKVLGIGGRPATLLAFRRQDIGNTLAQCVFDGGFLGRKLHAYLGLSVRRRRVAHQRLYLARRLGNEFQHPIAGLGRTRLHGGFDGRIDSCCHVNPRSDRQETSAGKLGRSGEIRTPDPLVPNQMRYQAALRSECRMFRPGFSTQSYHAPQGGRALSGYFSVSKRGCEILSPALSPISLETPPFNSST